MLGLLLITPTQHTDQCQDRQHAATNVSYPRRPAVFVTEADRFFFKHNLEIFSHTESAAVF